MQLPEFIVAYATARRQVSTETPLAMSGDSSIKPIPGQTLGVGDYYIKIIPLIRVEHEGHYSLGDFTFKLDPLNN